MGGTIVSVLILTMCGAIDFLLIGGFFTARLASTGTIGIGIVLILIWLGGMGMVKQKMDKGRQEDEEKRLREAAIKKLDEEERAKKA